MVHQCLVVANQTLGGQELLDAVRDANPDAFILYKPAVLGYRDCVASNVERLQYYLPASPVAPLERQ